MTRIVPVALVVMFVMVALPGYAKADGTYRWQNAYWNLYLAVAAASHADGASVLVWSLTNEKNRLWADNKLSSGYYRIRAVHSWKALDHYASTGGGGNSEARCDVAQWRWHGATWQQWEYRKFWAPNYRRHFVMWQNRYGCEGNVYHDTLGTVEQYANTFLYRRRFCELGFEPTLLCSWKRNGK